MVFVTLSILWQWVQALWWVAVQISEVVQKIERAVEPGGRILADFSLLRGL